MTHPELQVTQQIPDQNIGRPNLSLVETDNLPALIESAPRKENEPMILIRESVMPGDIGKILRWMRDPDTQMHIDPLPKAFPTNWNDKEQITKAEADLEAYYQNYDDDANKILPLIAQDESGKPVGALTLRWRGDPFVPVDARIASIERLIVDPRKRRKGIARRLMETALEKAFQEPHYQNNQPAAEVRLWVMTEKNGEKVPDYGWNLNMFLDLGFDFHKGPRGKYEDESWEEFLKQRGIPVENRGKARWLKLKREDWLENQQL